MSDFGAAVQSDVPEPRTPSNSMRASLQNRMPSAVPFFKRAIDYWPYVFMTISVVGLAYIALNAMR